MSIFQFDEGAFPNHFRFQLSILTADPFHVALISVMTLIRRLAISKAAELYFVVKNY